ncbi:hypothetical protein Pmani_027766, partial [Petrolisthes manimaculis]
VVVTLRTLPTLTLQPYFTLPPPPLISSWDTHSSPIPPVDPKVTPVASSMPGGSERERKEKDEEEDEGEEEEEEEEGKERDAQVEGEETQGEEGEEAEKEEIPQPHFSSRNATLPRGDSDSANTNSLIGDATPTLTNCPSQRPTWIRTCVCGVLCVGRQSSKHWGQSAVSHLAAPMCATTTASPIPPNKTFTCEDVGALRNLLGIQDVVTYVPDTQDPIHSPPPLYL